MTKPNDPVALDFDHFANDLAQDPYPTYKHLRENCPVGWSEHYGGFWVITSYEHINEVLHKPDVFSSYPNAIPEAIGQPSRMIPLEIDPPEHTAYRKILDPFFGLKKLTQILEPEARRLAATLIDDMVAATGDVDFITSFAQIYPTMLFCQLVGWPESQRAHLSAQVERMFELGPLLAKDPKEYETASTEIQMAVAPVFFELLEQNREKPKDDYVGYLMTAHHGDDRHLEDLEILSILFTSMLGGLETVKSVLGNSFAYLGVRHDLRDQIATDPEIIPSAIEEMLRFESPVLHGRTVVQDVELNGQQLSAGERVWLIDGSAGRDGKVFDNPDEVDLLRSPNRHLAFAAGRHRCVGSHLARMELRIAFEELHKRIPSYTVPPGAAIERRVGFSRAVAQLPFSTGQLAFA